MACTSFVRPSIKKRHPSSKLGEGRHGEASEQTAHKRTKVRWEIPSIRFGSAVGLHGGSAVINYAFWSRLEAREYHTAASNCGRTIEIGPTTHACTHNGTLPASVHDTMGGTSAGKHTADVAS